MQSKLFFPDPNLADEDGLVAVGGDLSVERLLLAYRSGIFPWTDNPITWWSPDPRAIFDLQTWQPSGSLKRLLRKKPFRLTFNGDFRGVMEGCAKAKRGGEGTWISPGFITAYTHLHEHGFAHSVEAWHDTRLVGGVYGVAIGSFFAGESMFHLEPDASKVALLALFRTLQERGFLLFDSQVLNPFTQQIGAIEISRLEYLQRLRLATAKQSLPFQANGTCPLFVGA